MSYRVIQHVVNILSLPFLLCVASPGCGSWDDVSAGRELALAQMAQGVDVIFQNADAVGLGVFQAARASRRALVFASNADQHGVAPEGMLGSVVIDLPRAFLSAAREVRDSRFSGQVITLGPGSNVVPLALNPALEPRLPTGFAARLDSARAELLRGVPSLPGRDVPPATP